MSLTIPVLEPDGFETIKTIESLKDAIKLRFGNKELSLLEHGDMSSWNTEKIKGKSPEKYWVEYGERLEELFKQDNSYREGKVIPSVISDYMGNKKFKKYTEWMLLSYIEGGIALYEDIKSSVKDSLEQYQILLDNKVLEKGNPSDPKTNETNIRNYCGMIGCLSKSKKKQIEKPGLNVLLEKYDDILEKYIEKKDKPKPGALIIDGKYSKIYKVRDQKDSKYYGQGTKWCTAAENDNMFSGYNKTNQMYIVIPNPKIRSYEKEKYQLAVDRETKEIDHFMDDKDEKPSDIKEVFKKYFDILEIDDMKIGGTLFPDYEDYTEFNNFLYKETNDDITFYKFEKNMITRSNIDTIKITDLESRTFEYSLSTDVVILDGFDDVLPLLANKSLKRMVKFYLKNRVQAIQKYGEIETWDTKNVTDMSELFERSNFNENISDWDTSSVANMQMMFFEATSFNKPLNWDTSSVTNMSYMFYNATSFDKPLNFDTSSVTNMSRMFREATSFNKPLNWDTSSVTHMNGMFREATSFNKPLKFDTSSVTNISYMFDRATSFNKPLNWDTSSVNHMNGMFHGATSFNQQLKFDTSSVTDMSYMFERATSFNKQLKFDTSSVTDMSYMFSDATSFDQQLDFYTQRYGNYNNMFQGSKGSLRGNDNT